MRLALSAVGIGLVVAGCVAITTESAEYIDKHGRALEGIYYSLPKGYNTVELSVAPAKAVFELKIKEPEFFADSQHQYYMNYRPAPNSNDEIKIQVGHKGFIKKIEVTVSDRLPEIILKALGRTPITREAAGLPKLFIPLFTAKVDFTDEDDFHAMLDAVNHAARAFSFARVAACDEASDNGPVCEEYRRLYDLDQPISLNVENPQPYVPASPADCQRGICYKPALPYRITASIGGRFRSTGITNLPNEAAPVLIDIRRAFAVEKVINITFDEDSGRLQEVEVKKPSEIEAVAGLPIEVAKAIFTIPTEFLQLKVSYVTEQENLAKKMYDLGKAERKLADGRSRGFVEATTVDESEAGSPSTVPTSSTVLLTAYNSRVFAAIASGGADSGNMPGPQTQPATDPVGTPQDEVGGAGGAAPTPRPMPPTARTAP